MATYQAKNTTTTTDYSDGAQIKTTDFTKKTNLATENTELSKPEFEYSKPVPTTFNTTHTTTTTATTDPTLSHNTYETGGSKTEQLKQKVSDLGHSIESAVNSASQHINDAVSHKNAPTTSNPSETQYNTVTPATTTTSELHSTNIHQQPHQKTGGLGAKLNDMMSHVGAALHSGHPIHAVTNAGTAVKVGECERIKHERGPIVDENVGTSHASSLDNPSFNAAGQPYENQSSAALHHPTTHTFNESTYNQPTTGTTAYGQSTYNQPITGSSSTYGSTTDNSTYTTGDKIRDMASHASAQLSHGNPIHAVTDAPAAARIAEAEKMKHAKGPIENTDFQSNQSIGGASGISGQGGASSTLSHSELQQQRKY